MSTSRLQAYNNLRQLVVMLLRNLLDAEYRIELILPKMANRATSPILREAFEKHYLETQGHQRMLFEAFDILVEDPARYTSEACFGMMQDTKKLLNLDGDQFIMDAGLIAMAHKIEHYEIASYKALAEISAHVGETKLAEIFQKIQQEEEAMDQILSQIAYGIHHPLLLHLSDSDQL